MSPLSQHTKGKEEVLRSTSSLPSRHSPQGERHPEGQVRERSLTYEDLSLSSPDAHEDRDLLSDDHQSIQCEDPSLLFHSTRNTEDEEIEIEEPEIVSYRDYGTVSAETFKGSRQRRKRVQNPLRKHKELFVGLESSGSFNQDNRVRRMASPPPSDPVRMAPERQQCLSASDAHVKNHEHTPGFMRSLLHQGSFPCRNVPTDDTGMSLTTADILIDLAKQHNEDDGPEESKDLEEKITKYFEIQYVNDLALDDARSCGMAVAGAQESSRRGRFSSYSTVDPGDRSSAGGEPKSIPLDLPSHHCFASFCTTQQRVMGSLEVNAFSVHFYLDHRESRSGPIAHDIHLPLCAIETTAVLMIPVSPRISKFFLLSPGPRSSESMMRYSSPITSLIKKIREDDMIEQDSDSDEIMNETNNSSRQRHEHQDDSTSLQERNNRLRDTPRKRLSEAPEDTSDLLPLVQVLVKESVASKVFRSKRTSTSFDASDPVSRSVLFQLNIDVPDNSDADSFKRFQVNDFCRFLNAKLENATPLSETDIMKMTQLRVFSGDLIRRILDDNVPSSSPVGATSPQFGIGTFMGGINRLIAGAQKKLAVSRSPRSEPLTGATSESRSTTLLHRAGSMLLDQKSFEHPLLISSESISRTCDEEHQCLSGFEFLANDDEAPAAEVLTRFHKAQLSFVLPATSLIWKLAFCIRRDGISFQTLYGKLKDQDRILMVVQEENGCIFGAFIPCEIKPNAGYYGSKETFLFTFRPGARDVPNLQFRKKFSSVSESGTDEHERSDVIKIYPWSEKNNLVMFSDYSSIALGGASGRGDFAITLDRDLRRGSSFVCETFSNDPLASQRDFTIKNLQFWVCER